MSVLDITSGAALSMRTFLSALSRNGWRAVALQATLFDSAQGGEHVVAAGEQAADKKVVRTQVLGVEHIIVKTAATRRPEMTCAEQERYLQQFRIEMIRRRPDMIILWGGMLLEMEIMREAREVGVPVVFYLVNSGYKNKDTFKYVSTIITDSEATAALYKERHGLKCHAIGKFIDTALVRAPKRLPKFITFINPSFEKGVNFFLPLAKLAATEYPDVQFLVVQSRGRWPVALKVLKFDPKDFPNVKVIGHQKDMRAVYANTRALLVPSVWYESGARVIPEALLNHIPVVASDSGGSKELVGTGGMVLPLPEHVKEKKTEAATPDDVRPWLVEVARIWRDEAHYQTLVAAAEKEAARHDIQRSVERFVAVVQPIVAEYKKMWAARQAARQPAAQLTQAVKQAVARKKSTRGKSPRR